MAKPQGLLSPLERQTYESFGIAPREDRLSLLPRYSAQTGLIAPQFIYDAAKALAAPYTAAQGYDLPPEEALNVGMNVMGAGSLGSAPKGALRSSSMNPVKPLGSIVDDATKSGLKLDVYEKNGVVNLSRIEVPKELRNSGIGSDVMNQIVNYADSTGNKVALTPSTDFGASSVSRLKDFYKKFGFVENKGKNKDFTTRETMYRNPKE
jgi:predicted GNAT family acetyltransferase